MKPPAHARTATAPFRGGATARFAREALSADTLPSSPATTPAGLPPPPKLSATQRIKFQANFARQMQVLVGTGIQLSQALRAVERQTRVANWKAVVTRLRVQVDEGSPLSRAMTDCPAAFDAVSVSIVSAGEASGNMAQMLERLSDLKRRQLKLRNTVVSAMAYPAMLSTMGVGVLVVMLMFVLPRFETLFASLDSPLPVTTRLLMHASTFLQTWWWAVALGGAAMIAGAFYAVSGDAGRKAFDRYYLRLPVTGTLGRNLLSARVARMLGTLLESKVALTESLELTRRAAVNDVYAQLIARAEDAVSKGQPLSSVTDTTDLLVPGVQEAIKNGESSGRMGQPLVQIADFLDEENDAALKALTSTLEPAILILLGLVVGVVALSIFLPMFDMITAAQGGT